jgi:hypothetical protein
MPTLQFAIDDVDSRLQQAALVGKLGFFLFSRFSATTRVWDSNCT